MCARIIYQRYQWSRRRPEQITVNNGCLNFVLIGVAVRKRDNSWEIILHIEDSGKGWLTVWEMGTLCYWLLQKTIQPFLSPGQTIATCQRNISQHCWAQHVACIWPPCCDVLQCVGCCWLNFDTGQICANNTQHIATCHNKVAKCKQHVAPNNVAIVWPGLKDSLWQYVKWPTWRCIKKKLEGVLPIYTKQDLTSTPTKTTWLCNATFFKIFMTTPQVFSITCIWNPRGWRPKE